MLQQLLVREPGRIDTGMLTVSNQRSTPSLESGSHNRLKTIHHADGVLYRIGEARPGERRRQAHRNPTRATGHRGPRHPQRKRGLKSHLGRIAITRRSPLGTQQTAQQDIRLTAMLIDTPEGGYRALAGLASSLRKDSTSRA